MVGAGRSCAAARRPARASGRSDEPQWVVRTVVGLHLFGSVINIRAGGR
jgi:hypothetical protein